MTYPTMYVALDVSGNPLVDPPDWTEATEWVCHETMQITRGRSRGSDDFQPASGSFSLISEAGRFDPSDSTGAYFPNFGLRTRVYIAATLGVDAYDLAVGYITSVNVRWNHRGEQIADVTWVDLLGILATYELPESVWDWVVEQHNPMVWHKLGSDSTNTVRDYSGNDRHGRYVTFEGVNGPYDTQRTPNPVVQAGIAEPLIPSSPRPSQAWGKMIASADQPLDFNDPGDNWRATSIVCDQSTASLMNVGQDWTLLAWVTFRPAYVLDAANVRELTGIDSGLFQWGDVPAVAEAGAIGPVYRLGFRNAFGYPRITYCQAGGGFTAADSAGSPLTGNLPTEQFYVSFKKTGTDLLMSVRGGSADQSNTLSVSSVPLAAGFPLVIAPSSGRGGVTTTYSKCGWWGQIGDVLVFDSAIDYNTVEQYIYSAGRWGHNYGDSVGAYTFLPGDVINMIAVDMIAATDLYINFPGYDYNGHPVDVGPFDRRTALEVFRLVAASEGGPLYVNKSGDLVFLMNTWPLTMTEATTVQWVLTDDDIVDATALGHTGGTLSLDDSQIVNDCTVTWKGGTAQDIDSTSVGRYGRFRKSITTALTDPDDAKQRAAWETWRRANPTPDLGSITVEPVTDLEFQAAMSLDFGHRVRVILTRPDGSQFDRECHVESISHSIDMGQGAWRTTLGLFAADSPGSPFVIGTSLLDGDDVLWY